MTSFFSEQKKGSLVASLPFLSVLLWGTKRESETIRYVSPVLELNLRVLISCPASLLGKRRSLCSWVHEDRVNITQKKEDKVYPLPHSILLACPLA